jgi:hypothetical protein
VLWLLVLLAAGCGGDKRFLPVGDYAGSTDADHAFTISITDKPKVNGEEAEWIDRGSLRVKKGPRPVVLCESRAEGEELHCVIKVGGQPDMTVDLVRL